MKKKVLISIVGIALFAVAIGFGLNNTQEDNLKVKKFKQPPKETGVDSIVPLPGFLKEIIKRIFVPKPKFDHEKCILCGECIRVCPSKPKSLKIQDDKVKINRETCIRCFCCQEMCPEGAIKSRRNLWF